MELGKEQATDSPYVGLSGLELLRAMHDDGKESQKTAHISQTKYARAVCWRAGVEYPNGFFDGDPEEIWTERCRQIGVKP